MSIFEFIEICHNRKRIYSVIGYKISCQLEKNDMKFTWFCVQRLNIDSMLLNKMMYG